jgi:hypothetical protein
MTKHWLLFVIYALCTYRLSVLVTLDEITSKLRSSVVKWSTKHKHPMIAMFIGCTWCVSIWIAGGVVVLARFGGSWAVYPCAALAFSAIAGFLSERE